MGLTAVLCLLDRRRLSMGALFTLALTAQGAVDIPLSALMLCAAALSLPLLSLRADDRVLLRSDAPPAPAD